MSSGEKGIPSEDQKVPTFLKKVCSFETRVYTLLTLFFFSFFLSFFVFFVFFGALVTYTRIRTEMSAAFVDRGLWFKPTRDATDTNPVSANVKFYETAPGSGSLCRFRYSKKKNWGGNV